MHSGRTSIRTHWRRPAPSGIPGPKYDVVLIAIYFLWHVYPRAEKYLWEQWRSLLKRWLVAQYSYSVLLVTFDWWYQAWEAYSYFRNRQFFIQHVKWQWNDKHVLSYILSSETYPMWNKKSSRFCRKVMMLHTVRNTLQSTTWALGIHLSSFAVPPPRTRSGGGADKSACVLVSWHLLRETFSPPWMPFTMLAVEEPFW